MENDSEKIVEILQIQVHSSGKTLNIDKHILRKVKDLSEQRQALIKDYGAQDVFFVFTERNDQLSLVPAIVKNFFPLS